MMSSISLTIRMYKTTMERINGDLLGKGHADCGIEHKTLVAASRCCAICKELCYCEQAKEEEVICVA